MAGQSDPHLSLFSAEEVEFMAEDELVEIVPNMRMDALNLVCGDFGPFMPQIATQVPLWLAVALKKRGKCTISCPEWMSVEKLTEVLEAERESPRVFQPLPFHYVEISRLLFDHAREDIPDTYMVRSLVEDIRNVRFHKIEINLEEIQGRAHAVKIKNLSAMEVNIVRPFVVRALQAFYKHDSPEMIDQVQPSTIRQPQATDNIPRWSLPLEAKKVGYASSDLQAKEVGTHHMFAGVDSSIIKDCKAVNSSKSNKPSPEIQQAGKHGIVELTTPMYPCKGPWPCIISHSLVYDKFWLNLRHGHAYEESGVDQ